MSFLLADGFRKVLTSPCTIVKSPRQFLSCTDFAHWPQHTILMPGRCRRPLRKQLLVQIRVSFVIQRSLPTNVAKCNGSLQSQETFVLFGCEPYQRG